MAYSSIVVANAFLRLAKRDEKPLTNMKLQKLLYFADGHSLSIRNEPLIADEPEAWDYGPVFVDVYHQYKHFGASPIAGPARLLFSRGGGDDPLLPNKSDAEFLEAIWKEYSDLHAIRLSEMTHVANGPWAQAYEPNRRGRKISKDSLKHYFDSLTVE